MTLIAKRRFAGIAILFSITFLGVTALSHAQESHAAPKSAVQQFKNIQVLKDIPADELVPTMQFIAGALGVECQFCHVEHAMEKDDKKEKQTARKMMAMELTINADQFDSRVVVTCYTCHRGLPHPVGIPILSAEASATPPHESRPRTANR